jgi:hypothetical protein
LEQSLEQTGGNEMKYTVEQAAIKTEREKGV